MTVPILARMAIKRSLYTNIYYRSYRRLDAVLAEIFGLSGFISLIIFWLYRGYNKWSYDQWRLEQLGLESEKTNIIRYFIFYLCCKEQNRGPIVETTDMYKMKKTIDVIKGVDYEDENLIDEDLSKKLVEKRHTLN